MLKDAFTFEKLLQAHKKCRLSKQHKRETISFEINLGANLTTLSRSLLNQTYKVGGYRQFYIYEPKKRNIEALCYKDRVVLMAFCTNIIEPKLEKKLIYDNVACRKNKGTFFGIKRLEKFLHDYFKKHKTNKGYFLKCDIKKYFQSINHDVLFQNLKTSGLDEEDLWLVNEILNSRNSETGVGLPIGNQTSQWFGLFYLNKIDRLIKEKLQIKYYVRYMDDMILVHHNKEYLKHCKQQIEEMANTVLKLQLNSKTQICQLKNGIDFLGFRHVLTNSGKVVRFLRGQAKTRLKKNLKKLRLFKGAGLINDEFISLRLKAYGAHLSQGNTWKLFNNLKKKNNL